MWMKGYWFVQLMDTDPWTIRNKWLNPRLLPYRSFQATSREGVLGRV